MLKKVNVAKLKIGHYIHDFNAPWYKHPFFKNSIYIKDESQLKKIKQSGISSVIIDTSRGLDVLSIDSKDDVKKYFKTETENFYSNSPDSNKQTRLKEEFESAKKIKAEIENLASELSVTIQTGNKIQADKIESVVEKVIDSVSRNKNAMSLLTNIKGKSEATFVHSIRVSIFAIAFAKYLKLNPEEIKTIGIAALVHDFGKLHLPGEVLNKQGKLSFDEFSVYHKHPELGKKLLEKTDGISKEVQQIVLEHHEQYDGFGYPNGLKGNEISQSSQIVSICNVYDHLTCDTDYTGAFNPVRALKMIYDLGNIFFESDFTQQFIKAMSIYPVGTLVRMKSNHLAIILESNDINPFRPKIRRIYSIQHNHYISPCDIDLAKLIDITADQIVSVESPKDWNIDIEKFLDLSNVPER